MSILLRCFFCIIMSGVALEVAAAPMDYLMPSDTTPPAQTGVVQVKPLTVDKNKKKKQVRIKETRHKEAIKKAAKKSVQQPATTEKKSPTKKVAATKNRPKTTTDTAKKTTPTSTKPTEKKASPTTDKTRPTKTEQPPSASADNKKTAASKRNKQAQPLSAEEELRLLAQAPATTAEQRSPMLRPEQCTFAFDHIDEFTGTRKRGLAPRLFFTYTPEQYRKFLKTKDFIRCEGHLSQSSEGGLALNITLTIATAAAKEKFGDLAPNSNLTLRTMQGKEFFLLTYQGATATVKGDATVYEASFVLTKADAKQLAEAEVDQVRLRFTKGFQLYEVYYLDFLREQFPCFKR